MATTTQFPVQSRLSYKRAAVMFLLAYIVVTILGIALSLGIGAVGHMPQMAEPLQNQAYLLAERFYPFLNLFVWGTFAWIYFRKPAERSGQAGLRKEAWTLGAFWLVVAIVVDYVGFVLIKNPISLSPHDFYIGQFPWIYLIYVAILISPWCYVALAKRGGK